MSSELEHWYINATVYKERVEELHYISDPARQLRRAPHTRVWHIEQLLGRGGFGEVRLERNKAEGQVRAVKRIPTTGSRLSKTEWERELKALLEFSKPKYKEAAVFIEFYGWFKDNNEIFLAMEYAPLGDLQKNVIQTSRKVPESECRDIAEQVISGLDIMHKESFAHRDLKPQNILVIRGPPKWWVKLADFGLSKRLTNTTAFHTMGGTQSFMAPELLGLLYSDESSSGYTNAVDIWSAGCIIYFLVTGVVPFRPGPFLMKYCEDAASFPVESLFDSDIKSEGFKFLRQLLASRPKARPSASEALKHQWIRSGSHAHTDEVSSELSSPLAPNDKSMLSEPVFSSFAVNTASHAGLQSSQTSSHSSLQTMSPAPASSSRLSASPSLPQGKEGEEVISTNNTLNITLVPKELSKVMEGSMNAIQNRGGSWTAKDFNDKRNLSSFKRGIVKLIGKSSPGMLKGHTDRVYAVAFSPDGKLLASASWDKTIRLLDPATGVACRTLKGHTDGIYAVAFSPDGKLLASGSADNTVRLWDPTTGVAHRTLEGHTGGIYAVAFSLEGKLLALSPWDKTVRLWDPATGVAHRTLEGYTDEIWAVAFSPDGKLLASASTDNTAQLLDPATGVAYRTLKGHTDRVYAVAFSPDGKLLASASWDKTIRLWDPTTGVAYRTLEGHTDEIWAVAFSPDGKLLASASADNTVRLWDPATGVVYRTLTGHTNRVWAVAFSPDGRLLASASWDKTVRLWEET